MDNNELKEVCKHMYIEGYKEGRNVEKVPEITIRTAERKFELLWEQYND